VKAARLLHKEENKMNKLTMAAVGLSMLVGSAFAAAPQAATTAPTTKASTKKAVKKNVKVKKAPAARTVTAPAK
jgi:hypothetical protein